MTFSWLNCLVVGTLLISTGCHDATLPQPAAVDATRCRVESVQLDETVTFGSKALAFQCSPGKVVSIAGRAVSVGDIRFPPSAGNGPLTLPAEMINSKKKLKTFSVEILVQFLKADGASEEVVDYKVINPHTDTKKFTFSGELTIPSRRGQYEVRGYVLWFDMDYDRPPVGRFEPEKHVIFSFPITVR